MGNIEIEYIINRFDEHLNKTMALWVWVENNGKQFLRGSLVFENLVPFSLRPTEPESARTQRGRISPAFNLRKIPKSGVESRRTWQSNHPPLGKPSRPHQIDGADSESQSPVLAAPHNGTRADAIRAPPMLHVSQPRSIR